MNNSINLRLDRYVALYALHSDTLCQSQVWINEEGAICGNAGETDSPMWKRWTVHSSSSLSKNNAFRVFQMPVQCLENEEVALFSVIFTRIYALCECVYQSKAGINGEVPLLDSLKLFLETMLLLPLDS